MTSFFLNGSCKRKQMKFLNGNSCSSQFSVLNGEKIDKVAKKLSHVHISVLQDIQMNEGAKLMYVGQCLFFLFFLSFSVKCVIFACLLLHHCDKRFIQRNQGFRYPTWGPCFLSLFSLLIPGIRELIFFMLLYMLKHPEYG